MSRLSSSLANQAGRMPTQNPSARISEMLVNAVAHHRAGRLAEAQQIYLQILAIDVRHADTLHLLGVSENELGHPQVALKMIRRAIACNGENALYHSSLGSILENLGQHVEAEAACRRAIELNPNLTDALNNLGASLNSLNKWNEAASCYQQALKIKPDIPESHYNLGISLNCLNRPAEAVAAYKRALELKPNYPKAYNNLGMALTALNQLEEAAVAYQQALALKPDYADAYWNLSLVELVQEDFASGWKNYEWRWKSTDSNLRMHPFSQPLWDGERLASGKLLIWGEQGIGDEIIFAGLIPEVIRKGNRCILGCSKRLQPLFARSFPEVQVITGFVPGHDPDLDFSAHLPSGNLPGLLRTTMPEFAATTSPYLVADPLAQSQLRARYADGRRVIGLAWHTVNPKTGRSRSLDLSLLAPLFARSDIRWVSLQYGNHDTLEEQAAAAGAPLFIDRSVDQMQDIDLFAAQVAAMDLVITIDNSTAHLAGALGVPTWVLLPFAPDWRWFLQRKDSPWYPSVRLFRQQKIGDWHPVVQQVERALEQMAE